jgi:hypothetical protein
VSRKTIGIIVILIWVAGLGALYRRSVNTTLEQRLTEVGMRISPERYYYTLEQNGSPIGVAMSAIDTSKTRVTAFDLVRGRFPVGNDTLRIEARSEARFTRGMRLRDFIVRADGDIAPFMIRGVMQEGEEKMLRTTTLSKSKHDKPITQEAIAEAPVFIPTMAPLTLMLTRSPKIGDSVRVSMYDPTSRNLKTTTMKIQADSLFLIADSATFDSTSNHWIKAHQDSLRGWRITGRSSPITVWVDAGGRLIAASEPGGISMLRTAFEIAFANWKIEEAQRAPDVYRKGR